LLSLRSARTTPSEAVRARVIFSPSAISPSLWVSTRSAPSAIGAGSDGVLVAFSRSNQRSCGRSPPAIGRGVRGCRTRAARTRSWRTHSGVAAIRRMSPTDRDRLRSRRSASCTSRKAEGRGGSLTTRLYPIYDARACDENLRPARRLEPSADRGRGRGGARDRRDRRAPPPSRKARPGGGGAPGGEQPL